MMNNSSKYWLASLMIMVMALPGKAQQRSPEETKVHSDMVMRKERHREHARHDRAEKRAAKAEKRINDKPQHQLRRKGRQQKGEKSHGKG